VFRALKRRIMPARRISPRELGRMGERRAAWYYRWRGWSVVAANLRSPLGEIDLVVRRGRVAAFVEVKTRQTRTAGEPWEAVNPSREERLARAAERLAPSLGLGGLTIRVDVVSLYWDGWGFEIGHFPGAGEIDPMRRSFHS
jgi:putative endonuclease